MDMFKYFQIQTILTPEASEICNLTVLHVWRVPESHLGKPSSCHSSLSSMSWMSGRPEAPSGALRGQNQQDEDQNAGPVVFSLFLLCVGQNDVVRQLSPVGR